MMQDQLVFTYPFQTYVTLHDVTFGDLARAHEQDGDIDYVDDFSMMKIIRQCYFRVNVVIYPSSVDEEEMSFAQDQEIFIQLL